MSVNNKNRRTIQRAVILLMVVSAAILLQWLFINFKKALYATPEENAANCIETIVKTNRSPYNNFEIHFVRQDCKIFWDYLSVQLVNNNTGKKTEIIGAATRVQVEQITIEWVDSNNLHVNYGGSIDALNSGKNTGDIVFGIKLNMTTDGSYSDD